MSKRAGKAYHPINGAVEEVWEGFSWPCLFLGFIWYIYKGMWGWGVIAFILAILTWGFSWIVFPFFANDQHIKSLLKRGYLTEKQWNERKQGEFTSSNAGVQRQAVPSVADELTKLAALKEQGVLSEEKFSVQKRRLLS